MIPVTASDRSVLKGALSTLGVAIVCNACCWLPPLLLALGGFGAKFAERLDPWRPYLLVLMAIQLIWGFRNAYRSHSKCCQVDDRHARRVRIGVMWFIAILVVALNLIPHHH